MKPQEVVEKVFELIDGLCGPDDMSKEDYLEVLQSVRDDADIRAESVQQELENEADDE